MIFDEGTYQSLASDRKNDVEDLRKGLQGGNLKFRLNGEKLQGEFALVKIKNDEQNAWLLIKHKDKFAVHDKFDIEKLIGEKAKHPQKKPDTTKASADKETEPKPETFPYSPMLAEPADAVFSDPNYVFERKRDGYRILATTGKTVKLITRKGQDYTENYPAVAKALREIEDNAVLDGEITVENEDGKEAFQSLQNFGSGDEQHILKYYVFDLLYLNGHDLLEMPLIRRKEILKKLLQKQHSDKIIYHEHVGEKGKELFEQAIKKGWEGVIAKKADSEYYIGRRSNSWLKFKQQNSTEAIICGYTEPAGARKYFGALVLGLYENGGLQYIGNCGTGFDQQTLQDLYERMQDLTGEKPFAKSVAVNQQRNVTWIKPELVCEVDFAQWTDDHNLRHAVYKGLRIDKSPQEVTWEAVYPAEKPSAEKVKKPVMYTSDKNVKLSNLDKLYWKNEGFTKGDLLHYYAQVSAYLLPYIQDKPLSLNRQPNGFDQPGFFQKDVNVDEIPKWLKTVSIHSESTDKEIDYLLCNDRESLLYMVNLGCIEINPWLSNYQSPENPEFMVIDLDPDGNDFSEVKTVALSVKTVFDRMEIPCFVKTSGSRGMHIYIYLGAGYDYGFVKKFAGYVAQLIHREQPEITSLERGTDKRKGLIYLDYLQNRRGQTVAAPYSVRPKPGATVSMPVFWEEVDADLQLKNFTLKNVPALLKEREDPWRNICGLKPDLLQALKLSKINT